MSRGSWVRILSDKKQFHFGSTFKCLCWTTNNLKLSKLKTAFLYYLTIWEIRSSGSLQALHLSLTRLKQSVSQHGCLSGRSEETHRKCPGKNLSLRKFRLLAECSSLWLQDWDPHFLSGCLLGVTLAPRGLSPGAHRSSPSSQPSVELQVPVLESSDLFYHQPDELLCLWRACVVRSGAWK